jgi:hypothetical protein
MHEECRWVGGLKNARTSVSMQREEGVDNDGRTAEEKE